MSVNEGVQISTNEKENVEIKRRGNKKTNENKSIKRIILVPRDDEPSPSDPINKYVEKVILKVVDQYVKEMKRPIRRKDLEEYVFTYDSRMQEYDKVSKHDRSIISFAITRLLKRGKLVRVEYCKHFENGKCLEYYRRKEYLLPEHLEMPEVQEYLKKNGLISQ